MPATIVPMDDPNIELPEFLVVDASVVLVLHPSLSRRNPHFQVAYDFLQILQVQAQSGNVMPILPRLAFEECVFKICQHHIMNSAISNGLHRMQWQSHYKANPSAIQLAKTDIQILHSSLLAIPFLISEPEDLAQQIDSPVVTLSERMLYFTDSFNLLPKDATIISVAERLDINTLATMDSDWRRADGFTVITPI